MPLSNVYKGEFDQPVIGQVFFVLLVRTASKSAIMSQTPPPRTIAVAGATGRQGQGIVQALLSDTSNNPWLVRALTQDPQSAKAQEFLSRNQTSDGRLSLVAGQVYDAPSLLTAFDGAYGVFAMTSERYPGKSLTEEEDLKHEIDAGRNMIVAAKKCGVKHFVFSSLPDVISASNGKYTKIYHMNNKHIIEQLAREQLDGFSSLIPGT